MSSPPDFRLRLKADGALLMGPGRADLLELIQETGSIAAAAKKMGMSWRRAWLLVDVLNNCFDGPLVTASRGGKAGGNSTLTPLGEEVLHRYRAMETASLAATKADRAFFKRHATKAPK
jgi:molybdate transport system regulatory protein